jgi:hypothetical protein
MCLPPYRMPLRNHLMLPRGMDLWYDPSCEVSALVKSGTSTSARHPMKALAVYAEEKPARIQKSDGVRIRRPLAASLQRLMFS